jgi:hypothetical protein
VLTAGVRVGGTLLSDVPSKLDGPAPTHLRLIEYKVRSLAVALRA